MSVHPCPPFLHPGDVPDGTDAGCRVVRPQGDLDLASSAALGHRLDALLDDGASTIVLDLAGVPFCDVPALEVLLRADRRLRDAGGRLLVTRPRPPLTLMLSALGMADRLTVVP